MSVLAIEGLTVRYAGAPTAAVDGLDLVVERHESVALVGESGGGKSTIARAALGMLPRAATVAGRLVVGGCDMVHAPEEERRATRGRVVALVPQDTGAALNPVVAVVDQVAEVYRVHGGERRRAARARAAEVLDELGLPGAVAARRLLPDELSGGMRQRALVAIALALAPRVVVADEPTSSLDPESTLEVLDALARMRERSGAALLLVTHDLGVAAAAADRVAVLAAGRIVESGPTAAVLGAPEHVATRALVAAVPALDDPEPRPGGAA